MGDSEGSMELDSSETTLCMKCGKEGNLLICSTKTCPIAVHRRCMKCRVSFDGDGRFCCPYCMCRKSEEELLGLKKNCLSRREDLVNFMRPVVSSNVSEEYVTEEDNDGRKESKDHSEKSSSPSFDGIEGRNNGDSTGFVDERALRRKRRVRNGVEHGPSGDSLGRIYLADAKKSKVVDADAENSQKKEDGGNSSPRSEALPENKTEHYSASEDEDSPVGDCKDEDISKPAQDLSIIVYQAVLNPQRISFRTPASVPDNYRFDGSASSKRRPCRILPFDDDVLTTRKSKRVRWSSEEVEMLKKGVKEFSQENRNIPWRKILLYGIDVFNAHRTPSDLKEKWKKVSRA